MTDTGTLDALYPPPHEFVMRKQQSRIDAQSASFVAAAALVVLATAGPDGADASPRGGPPGFVRVVDEHRLAFGDLSGNNRIDSYRNLDQCPDIGMLFIVPGMEETLRVNGRASLTTDPDILDATTIDGRRPHVAVVVEVLECYVHCAKALRRARVWDVSTWPDAGVRPSAGAAFVAHLDLQVSADVVEADLEAGYEATMWDPGGDAGPAATARGRATARSRAPIDEKSGAATRSANKRRQAASDAR